MTQTLRTLPTFVHRRPEPRHWLKASCRFLLVLAAGSAIAAPLLAQPKPAPAVTPSAQVRNGPAAATPASAEAVPCGRVELAPAVQVSVGKSTVLRPGSPVRRVLLGNPEGSRAARPSEKAEKADSKAAEAATAADEAKRPGVAEIDVLLLSPTEVYLLGKSIGSTNVVLLDQAGRCTAFDVVVTMDIGALQAVLTQLLPNERNIRVSAAFDSIVLSGGVTDSGALARAVELAQAYVGTGRGGKDRNPRVLNMLGVDAPQQVMLEVKVAEVSKTLVDKLGVSISGVHVSSGFTYQLLTNFLSGSAGMIGLSKNSGSLDVLIDAEKRDGVVKILAEPNIMAISGQEGSFLAGGKIFIPVSQDSANGSTRVTLEEKEFGISVRFTPTVLDNGRINLKVAPEVSELNRDGVGIRVGAFNAAVLPAFTTRRAATTIQLLDGQSFAIGGLIKNNTVANIKALPLLGELPVIGALFRSTDFQADRSELVFIITPRLVKPFTGEPPLPTDAYTEPSRKDLFIDGRLEGRQPPADQGFQVKPESK